MPEASYKFIGKSTDQVFSESEEWEREDIMLATVKGNVKENTVVIDDEEIDNYMEEMR